MPKSEMQLVVSSECKMALKRRLREADIAQEL
jgi:hypothetical protein